MLGDLLAEAVLGLAGDRDEGMAGVDHRLHRAVGAALGEHAVEMAMHGERVGGDLLRVVPSSQLPTTSTISNLLPVGFHDRAEADDAGHGRPSCRAGRGPRGSCREFLPSFSMSQLADMTPISNWSSLTSMTSLVSRMLSKGTMHDVVAVGQPDHPVEAGRADRDGDDGVIALVDEVLDGAELCGGVGAGSRRP